MKMRQVRKTINELVNEGKLKYRLSSDSTLYFRIDTDELDK
jgi:hypothetical protein